MHRIVPWQVALVLVIIGTYVAVLINGGSEQTAAAFAAVSAAVAFAVSTFTISVAVISAAVIFFAAFTARALDVRCRWRFAAYDIEALAVWGALVVGGVGWSIAIALSGIALLLVFWRVAS